MKALGVCRSYKMRWKEMVPWLSEAKDAMWKEFKDALLLVNKRHDDYYKQRHEQEQANSKRKTK